mgnify:CR=1 FL=1
MDGSLHLVPNGDVRIVSNLTREWSRALVDFGVAYEEDLDKVVALLAAFAEELAADEELGPLLIGKPEIVAWRVGTFHHLLYSDDRPAIETARVALGAPAAVAR